jgi:hypothetical protein
LTSELDALQDVAPPHGSVEAFGAYTGAAARASVVYRHRITRPLSVYSRAWVETNEALGLRYEVSAGVRYEW